MILTVLMENTGPENLVHEHGLSVYINYNGHHILLDGARSGRALENAMALGVDITQIELAVLSHGHYDHGDGLTAFLEANRHAPVYLRPRALEPHFHGEKYIGLSDSVREKLKGRGRFGDETAQILPGVWLVPDPIDHEQSLVLEGETGLVILNSCCHAGAGHIVKDIKAKFPGKPVAALVGGLHLMGRTGTDSLGVEPGIVKNLGKWLLDELEVGTLYTGHCTGRPAFDLLKEGHPERVQHITSGLTISL